MYSRLRLGWDKLDALPSQPLPTLCFAGSLAYNAAMNEKHIAQLEAQLESIVEGSFANLFRKRVTAHDLAMKLARALENSLRYGVDADNRPLAADTYTIHLHPTVQEKLMKRNSTLSETLSTHMVELVAQSGYRLNSNPTVNIVANQQLDTSDVEVEAHHLHDGDNTTKAMQPIPKMQATAPANPQLIINDGERMIELTEPLLNVGRADNNHIVLDDAFCSRHHIQLRLRFGTYTLFDVNSRAGTSVNGIKVSEHQLQSGDVIRIGKTRIIYMANSDKTSTSTTQSLDPVTF